MKKTITTLLILCLAAGALSAMRHKGLFDVGDITSSMSRNRNWVMNQVLTDEWNGTDWQLTSKTLYYYNPVYFSRLDSLQMYYRNSASGTWDLVSKAVFTYTPNQEYISLVETFAINGANSTPSTRAYATYDDQNRLVSYRESSYITELTQWINYMRMAITYYGNSVGEVNSWFYGWVEYADKYIKASIVNDAQGRIITQNEMVSLDSTNWENDYQINYEYHPHDSLTGAQFISNLAHYWITNSYMQNGLHYGMVTEQLNKTWENSVWVNFDRIVNTYDLNDKPTVSLFQHYTTNGWDDDVRILFSYDPDGNLYQQTCTVNVEPNTWTNLLRYTASWTQTTANEDIVTPCLNDLELKVHPNPFVGNTTLLYVLPKSGNLELSIFNIRGQLVRKLLNERLTSGQHTVTWDGKDDNGKAVASGMYLCRISSAGKQETHKLLLMK